MRTIVQILHIIIIERTNETEKHWQQNEAIRDSKNNDSEPHFEKGDESIALSKTESDDSQESRKGTMEHTCSNG